MRISKLLLVLCVVAALLTPSSALAVATHTHRHHHHIAGNPWRVKVHRSTHPLTHRHCRRRMHRHRFYRNGHLVRRLHCAGIKHTHRKRWKRALASCYGIGDGFVGRRCANGSILRRNSMNFAHRTMRFGTRVQFKYKGRTVIATCTDRGPYCGRRTFDLGPGTARALRFNTVATIKWRRVK